MIEIKELALVLREIIEYEKTIEACCDSSFNSRKIGRGYYKLQSLVGGDNQLGGLSAEDFQDQIRIHLPTFSSESPGIKKNIGSLEKVLSLGSKEENLRLEMSFIFLESALNAFERSFRNGDTGPDNASYRGMCRVDLARLNGKLRKHSEVEMLKELQVAEGLLESVIERRKMKGKSDFYKDYSRLGECKFLLANLTQDEGRKRALYEEVINCEKLAVMEFRRHWNSSRIKPELYNHMASSYFKLAGISSDADEKIKYFKLAVEYIEEAKTNGDPSSENRSKKATCMSYLLKQEAKRGVERGVVLERLRQIKRTVEEAIEVNGPGRFVFPLFLLYFVSKDVEEGEISGVSKCDLDEIGLRESLDYVDEAIRAYAANDWAVTEITRSRNLVCSPKDNYGLFENVIILKQGKLEDLARESATTEHLKEALELSSLSKKYSTPKPLCITYHQDSNDRLSGHYYVMSQKHGITLEDFLEDSNGAESKTAVVLGDVIDYLAFIHATIPVEYQEFSQDRGKIDVGEKLEKLVKLDIGFREEDKVRVLEQYVLISGRVGSRLVFNKDSHPRNWILSNGGECIIALDFEGGVIPQAYDLVKLLDYKPFFNEQTKDDMIKLYLQSYGKYKGEENLPSFDELKSQYLHLSIHRVLTWVGNWEKGQIENDWNRNILHSLNNSICAAEVLSLRDTDYKPLYQILQRIHEVLH